MSVSSHAATLVRIQALESAVWPDKNVLSTDDSGSGSIVTRSFQLEHQLRQLVQSSKHEGLRRFVDHYESILQLLYPTLYVSSYPPLPTTLESLNPSLHPPLPTKLALLLESWEDITGLDSQFRQLGILLDRGADGAGDLASVVTREMQDRLKRLEQRHERDIEALKRRQASVVSLLTRWDTLMESTSQVFVNAHQTLTDMEHAVDRLERSSIQS